MVMLRVRNMVNLQWRVWVRMPAERARGVVGPGWLVKSRDHYCTVTRTPLDRSTSGVQSAVMVNVCVPNGTPMMVAVEVAYPAWRFAAGGPHRAAHAGSPHHGTARSA
jgi:hypothetical protein